MVKCRRHPYGTEMTGEVLEVFAHGKHRAIAVKHDEAKEATVCMFGLDEHTDVKQGDRVRLRFKSGGPTGGYWDITERMKDG